MCERCGCDTLREERPVTRGDGDLHVHADGTVHRHPHGHAPHHGHPDAAPAPAAPGEARPADEPNEGGGGV